MKKLFILVVLLVAGDGKEVRGVDPVEKVKSLSDSHAEETYWWLKKTRGIWREKLQLCPNIQR